MLVPEIWTDWDDEVHKRSYNQVEKRRYYTSEWGRVRREFKYLSIIYSLENILLSLPLLYTCGRLMYRHTILTPLHIEIPVRSYHGASCEPPWRALPKQPLYLLFLCACHVRCHV